MIMRMKDLHGLHAIFVVHSIQIVLIRNTHVKGPLRASGIDPEDVDGGEDDDPDRVDEVPVPAEDLETLGMNRRHLSGDREATDRR